MKIDAKYQAVFEAVRAELPSVTLNELDYGFTLVIYNPVTDIAAHLVRQPHDYWCANPETLITYLRGETALPGDEALLRVHRLTPEEVTAMIGDAIQRAIDRPR